MDNLQKLGILAAVVTVGAIVHGVHAGSKVTAVPIGEIGGVVTAVQDYPWQYGWTPSNTLDPLTDVASLIIYWRRQGALLPNAQGIWGTPFGKFDPKDYVAFKTWAKAAGATVPDNPPGSWGLLNPTVVGSWGQL